MSNDEYLREVLRAQLVKPESDEMKALISARTDIEKLLRTAFSDCSPTIQYGGSKAKGTMLLEEHDLDVICYFPHTDTAAGKNIEEIYENVCKALKRRYTVDPRTTALRVIDHDRDLGIDVVPGRFIDGTKTYAFLHQNDGPKERLQTNLTKHIEHVIESGCVEDIRLGKLWKRKVGISVRTFPLELLIIKILDGSRKVGPDARFRHLLTEMAGELDGVAIEDPANSNNDISLDGVRERLAQAAVSTLRTVDMSGWKPIFGAAGAAERNGEVGGPPRFRWSLAIGSGTMVDQRRIGEPWFRRAPHELEALRATLERTSPPCIWSSTAARSLWLEPTSSTKTVCQSSIS